MSKAFDHRSSRQMKFRTRSVINYVIRESGYDPDMVIRV